MGVTLWASVLCCCTILWITLAVSGKKQYQARIRACGHPPRPVPYHLPFGLDLVCHLVWRLWQHDFVNYGWEILDVPGRTVELNLLSRRIIVTDNPENIKAVMLSQFGEFKRDHAVHNAFHNIFGDSIFTSEGESWIRAKNDIRPQIAHIRPADLTTTEFHIQKMFDLIRTKPDGINVYEAMDRLQLDIVTDVFLGRSINSLTMKRSPIQDAIDRLVEMSMLRIRVGPMGQFLPDWLLAPRELKVLDRFMDGVVDKALAQTKEKPDAEADGNLNLVLEMAQKGRGRKYIREQITGVVFLASKDPTAITIAWAVLELARNPDIMASLRKEVEENIGLDRLPTGDQLKRLPLLRNVIRETMRLYPPLGLNVRQARHDLSLPSGGGPNGKLPVAVLQGQQVAIAVTHAQRRAEGLIDGETWIPSRWEGWTPKSTEYLPFNIGPRICLGRNFGILQVEYTLVRLLQEFEGFAWLDGGDRERKMKFKVELNAKAAEAIVCRFVERGMSRDGV
ncbi:cytochrome P450 [Hyaloscypha variabilis F]|uniref:Cytochrome P450 n=1 Tax=Hyaloscypha variabilis (strain UAMH 11265 / GT02V1 / F) TaxID=1149755 RepID=A0A2J6S7U0_HYAVF|nr:cytochrome P450 [Hyaloscypha variabilis F]